MKKLLIPGQTKPNKASRWITLLKCNFYLCLLKAPKLKGENGTLLLPFTSLFVTRPDLLFLSLFVRNANPTRTGPFIFWSSPKSAFPFWLLWHECQNKLRGRYLFSSSETNCPIIHIIVLKKLHFVALKTI